MGPALLTLALAATAGILGVAFACMLIGQRRFASRALCLFTSLGPFPIFVVMARLAMMWRRITFAD